MLVPRHDSPEETLFADLLLAEEATTLVRAIKHVISKEEELVLRKHDAEREPVRTPGVGAVSGGDNFVADDGDLVDDRRLAVTGVLEPGLVEGELQVVPLLAQHPG